MKRWIEKRRLLNLKNGQAQIIFDGHCGFCSASVRRLLRWDVFGYLQAIDYHTIEDLRRLHPALNKKSCESQIHLILPDGTLVGGFFVFRHLSRFIPALYLFIIIVYFPGASYLGPRIYRWIARRRHLFGAGAACDKTSCF